MAKSDQDQVSVEQLQEQLEQLQQELRLAQEREKRALADYQNVIRRNQDERYRIARAAAQEVVEPFLEPLTHLDLASKQLQDPGLQMVVNQFWQKLDELGLEKVDPQGQEFDVETMEVVEKQGEGDTVLEVRSPGYVLKGSVIQHARVVVG